MKKERSTSNLTNTTIFSLIKLADFVNDGYTKALFDIKTKFLRHEYRIDIENYLYHSDDIPFYLRELYPNKNMSKEYQLQLKNQNILDYYHGKPWLLGLEDIIDVKIPTRIEPNKQVNAGMLLSYIVSKDKRWYYPITEVLRLGENQSS